MEDWSWSDEEVEHLHQQVCEELRTLFDYDKATSEGLLSEWIAKFPLWTPDVISHESPFGTALHIQYGLAEGGDSSGVDFLEWRKPFNQIRQNRRSSKLTPMQEAILRSRGAI